MPATERGDDNPSDNTAISLQRAESKEGEGNVRPVSLVQQIFNDPEALNLPRQAFNSSSHEDGVHGAPKAPSSVTNSNSAGAFKAHSANENDTATYTPATKRPRGAENYSDEVVILEPDGTNPGTSHPMGEDDEDDELCHSARWQASEQLSAFLGTLHKPLSAFERKAITRKYPRPDVDCVYTPSLDNYLPSLLPGVKNVDKDNKFLQDRVLDSMGPVAMLFEHIYGFLAEAKPGENVILSYEQMKDLGAITSNAIRLLGNASALLSKERRKAVLNKINSKGTLSSLASEEFPQAGKSLFGEGFEARIKTRSETVKTLLSAASVGQNSRPAQFFRGRTTPFRRRGNRWGGSSQRFPNASNFSQFRGSFRGRSRAARGTLQQIPPATQ